MSTKCCKYLCGFNGFGQIDEIISQNAKVDVQSSTTCKFIRGGNQGMEGLCSQFSANDGQASIQHYCSPQPVDEDVVLITWCQIFISDDRGEISSFGYMTEEVTTSLHNHKVQKTDLKASIGGTVLLRYGSQWMLLQECGKLTQCVGVSDSDVMLLAATRDSLYGLKDGELYEGVAPKVFCDARICMQPVLPGINIVSVSCGLEHTMLLSQAGEVYTFGSGSRGQLGHGEVTVDGQISPRVVETFQGINVVVISAGGWHCTASTDTGDVYVWGWNESGQLGLPNNNISESDKLENLKVCRNERMEPSSGQKSYFQDLDSVQVQAVPYGLALPDSIQVKSVSCGTRHTCILTKSGMLLSTGWNKYGQLCHGDTISRDYLQTVQYFVEQNETVVHVSAQYWNTYIVTEKR